MGRFCFCALASFTLVRKDFWLCRMLSVLLLRIAYHPAHNEHSLFIFAAAGIFSGVTYGHRDGFVVMFSLTLGDVQLGKCSDAGIVGD
jgi:hypothetical protein